MAVTCKPKRKVLRRVVMGIADTYNFMVLVTHTYYEPPSLHISKGRYIRDDILTFMPRDSIFKSFELLPLTPFIFYRVIGP